MNIKTQDIEIHGRLAVEAVACIIITQVRQLCIEINERLDEIILLIGKEKS